MKCDCVSDSKWKKMKNMINLQLQFFFAPSCADIDRLLVTKAKIMPFDAI